MPPCSFGRRACRPGWSSRRPTPPPAVPGRGPRGDLGVGKDTRNRRRGRAPSGDEPRRRGHEPAGVTARRSGRRRAAAARRRRNVRRVVANVPRHHRRAEPAQRSPARARARRRSASAGCRRARRRARGSGSMARDDGRALRRRRRDRRHRAGEQPGTGRAGRAAVPGGAAPACLGARGGRLAHTAIYTALPGYRALLLPGTPDAGRLAAVIAGRGGATVAVEAAEGRRWTPDQPVPLPAGVPTRFVTPAVADVLAAELWSRASGKTP